MTMAIKTIPAGLFKQGCLALLDEVAALNTELVVTKRGRPVARVVPILGAHEQEAAVLARMRERARPTVGRAAEMLAPSSTLTRWNLMPKAKSR